MNVLMTERVRNLKGREVRRAEEQLFEPDSPFVIILAAFPGEEKRLGTPGKNDANRAARGQAHRLNACSLRPV